MRSNNELRGGYLLEFPARSRKGKRKNKDCARTPANATPFTIASEFGKQPYRRLRFAGFFLAAFFDFLAAFFGFGFDFFRAGAFLAFFAGFDGRAGAERGAAAGVGSLSSSSGSSSIVISSTSTAPPKGCSPSSSSSSNRGSSSSSSSCDFE